MRFAAFLGTLDEVDLLAANIAHLRRIGVDLIVVRDLGSTDGSLEVLESAEREGDVWVLQVSPADSKLLWLDAEVKLARSLGAEWVLFLDTDEFWLPASGSLHDLADLDDADILIVDRYNVAKSIAHAGVRDLPDLSPRGYGDLLLHTRGPDEYEKGQVQLEDYLDQHPEEAWIRAGGREPKVMARPEAVARIHDGHHDVDASVDRPWRRATATDVLIAHFPFTTLDRFEIKVANIRKSVALHPDWFVDGRGWQWTRWLREADAGRLGEEFTSQFLAQDVFEALHEAGAVQSVAEMLVRRGAINPVDESPVKPRRRAAKRSPQSSAKVESGPFRVFEVVAGPGVGQRGDELLSTILIQAGPTSLASREHIRGWWSSAQDVISGSEAGRHPFDLEPKNFRVTDDGTWHFQASGTTTRFAVPPEVLALRALMDLLFERIVQSGMPGVASSFSVRDAVAGLLGLIGLSIDDATVQLWIELEADLEIRIGEAPRSRETIRRALSEKLKAPLASFLTGEALLQDLRRTLAETSARAEELRTGLQETELRLQTAEVRIQETERRLGDTERGLQETARRFQETTRRLQETAQRAAKERSELVARLQRAEHGRTEIYQQVQQIDQERTQLALRAQRAEAALGWNASPSRLRRVVGALAHPRLLSAALASVPPLMWLVPNPLFDASWYLAEYDDVRNEGTNPYRHFRKHGCRENRNPNRFFDTGWYLEHYPDVRSSGLNPLDHYLRHGASEGRDPGPLFDSDWYIANNPDVRALGINPLLHYLRFGLAEARRARPEG